MTDEQEKRRQVRNDKKIDRIVRYVEREFDLPKGSVRLVYPSGRKARGSSTIRVLWENWQAS
ncbi:MAG: hypothetical protein ABL957_00140 [Parvularculaceae bacterium]